MVIQTQLSYNAFPFGDESQKDFNQQALFHYPQNQQYRSQSFLAAHMEKQMRETDLFIKRQKERLRYILEEQRKEEMNTILRKLETRALILMTQKEEEMNVITMKKALNKNMELEDLLQKIEMENQTWQRMAQENEVMVATLNSTLAEARERAAIVTVEDEESFCNFPAKKASCCWNCGSSGETRVLFLPCRHLCCCVDCEAGLVLCPICNTPKKSRIEVFDF